MFSEGKLFKAVQSIGIKSFYSTLSYSFKYKKLQSKLSTAMFIKRKARSGQAYSYENFLSFKTSVIYKCFYFTPDNCVRCEATFVENNSIFC